MSGSHQWTRFLSFRLTVAVGVADELTVGVVERPGRVEWLTLDLSAVPLNVRAWAMPAPVALRQGLAVNEVVGGELLTAVATDSTAGGQRTGLRILTAAVRTVAVGQMVSWAPWHLVVRVENGAAVAADVAGHFHVTLFETADLWGEMQTGLRPFEFGREGRWREEVRVGVGSTRVGRI